MMKQAILAVSYGTTYEEALTSSIGAWEDALRAAFPTYPVFRAFTGQRIIELLRKKNICVDHVREALARLAHEGFREVILQPSHLVRGGEYDKILAAAREAAGQFDMLRVGAPLLDSAADAEALSSICAARYARKGSALLLMGHGADPEANRPYRELNEHCRALGYPHMFVATAEASPCLEDILPFLHASGCREVVLAPLLFTAGRHACRDMAGDEPHSWKTRLCAEGFDVRAIVRGLGEYPEVHALYVRHLREAMACR